MTVTASKLHNTIEYYNLPKEHHIITNFVYHLKSVNCNDNDRTTLK